MCWSIGVNPTINDSKTSDSIGMGSFTSSILRLQPNTQYHVRAYAMNSVGTAYGQDVGFTTTQVGVPLVKTLAITNVTDSSLTIEGNVISDSGATVTARGVCWSTSAHPTINLNTKTNNGSGTGDFVSSVTGLQGGTIYYFRSYATNSTGTAYGNEIGTSTSKAVPTVITNAISNVTTNSATIGGSVMRDGGSPVLSRGVYWGPASNPTLHQTNDGSGIGNFSNDITGLTAGTYHVRAYATNALGASLGNEVVFTVYAPPTVLTNRINFNNITSTSATIEGNVTNDGGSPITARGICWSTTLNPTIADNKTVEGLGVGNFSSAITGLLPVTLYYARAYATNNYGTSYGSQVSFTTLQLTLTIGQNYGGGKVFYIDPNNRYALIGATEDIYQSGGVGYEWSNGTNVDIGITSTALGSYNTNKIISVQGNGAYAAKACKDYHGGGFLDWYLPSQGELNFMYRQKEILNMVNLESNSIYWSSTQQQGSFVNAYGQDFSTGTQSGYLKSAELRVRPIRGICLVSQGCSGMF